MPGPAPTTPRSTIPSKVLTVAGLFVIVAGLHLGHDLFVPMAFAILLTLILSPLVGVGQRLGLPRSVAVVIVVSMAFGALGLGGYFIAAEAATLGKKLPEYKANATAKIEALRVPFTRTLQNIQQAADDVEKGTGGAPPDREDRSGEAPAPMKVQVVQAPSNPLQVASAVLPPLVTAGGSLAVVVLLVLFLLIYQNEIRDRVIRLVGDAQVNMTTQTITEATRGVSRFLALQVIVNATYGVTLGAGLYAFGVPGALLWGVLGALLRFIPYLGPIGAGLLPVLISIGVFPGWTRPILVAGYIVVLELILNNLVEPMVYGKRTGLSPLAVVLATVFWAWMWGGAGLILAVPLTVCLLALGKYVPSLGFLGIVLGDLPALETKVQVYHRLLGRHPEEAAELLEKERIGARSLAGFYDGFVLPILRMADGDLRRGILEEEKAGPLFASLREIVDDLGESAASATGTPAEPGRTAVLCLPVDGPADELSAVMLAQVLNLRGIPAKALAVETMREESLEGIRAEEAGLLVVCNSPPSPQLRARNLYNRLRRRLGEIPVVAGVWGGDNLPALGKRIAPDGKALLVSSFVEAEAALARLSAEAAPRPQGAVA